MLSNHSVRRLAAVAARRTQAGQWWELQRLWWRVANYWGRGACRAAAAVAREELGVTLPGWAGE